MFKLHVTQNHFMNLILTSCFYLSIISSSYCKTSTKYNWVLKINVSTWTDSCGTSLKGQTVQENIRQTSAGHKHCSHVVRYLRPMYDRTLTGGELWNQPEYMQQVWGAEAVKKGSGVWLFSGPPVLVGQQQLKPDKHMHKHTSVSLIACTHAHCNFTLTWNSVVLRMWRPSGLQREETSPIEPSSILQCQSGCSRDHTYRQRQRIVPEGQQEENTDHIRHTRLLHL